MGSATSRKQHISIAPEGMQKDWPIFACRQGAFLFDPRAYRPVDPDEAKVSYAHVNARPERGFVVLPHCRPDDDLLNQPPLGLRLTQDEAEKLIADTTGAAGALAATDIGPDEQDKPSNQDFALAATFRLDADDAPTVYQFAAVADGVTTRTLWPERSARLAVFAAWRVARRHVEAHRGFSHEAFERFRDDLVQEIRAVLEADMVTLLTAGPSGTGLVPPGWAPDTYEQFKDRRELWYNSTLLVCLVGAEAGFIATCGDGGLVVRKTENSESKSVVVVRSVDDLSVSGVVSLGPDALQFRQTRTLLTADTRLEIILSTDGVDRSLRRDAGRDDAEFDPYGTEFSRTDSASRLHSAMIRTMQGIEAREIDNISTAVLHWPPSALPPLASPRYVGPIAAYGETIADINRKSDRAARRLLELRNRAATPVALPPPPPVAPQSLPLGPPLTFPDAAEVRPAAPLAPSVPRASANSYSSSYANRSVEFQRQAELNSWQTRIESAVRDAVMLAKRMDWHRFFDNPAFHDRIIAACRSSSFIHRSDNQTLHSLPNLSKLLFLMLASAHSTDSVKEKLIGHFGFRIDEVIRKFLGSSPSWPLRPDLAESRYFIELLFHALERDDDFKSQDLEDIKARFRRL
jgi:hypothetical protein